MNRRMLTVMGLVLTSLMLTVLVWDVLANAIQPDMTGPVYAWVSRDGSLPVAVEDIGGPCDYYNPTGVGITATYRITLTIQRFELGFAGGGANLSYSGQNLGYVTGLGNEAGVYGEVALFDGLMCLGNEPIEVLEGQVQGNPPRMGVFLAPVGPAPTPTPIPTDVPVPTATAMPTSTPQSSGYEVFMPLVFGVAPEVCSMPSVPSFTFNGTTQTVSEGCYTLGGATSVLDVSVGSNWAYASNGRQNGSSPWQNAVAGPGEYSFTWTGFLLCFGSTTDEALDSLIASDPNAATNPVWNPTSSCQVP